MKKRITSTSLMALGFLVVVVLYIKAKHLMSAEGIQISQDYNNQQLMLAVSGELLRAFFTDWLYLYHKTNQSLLTNALKFGLVCSALIGSIWLILGMEFLESQDRLSFLIDDGIILSLQGLVAGIVLWLVYRK